MATFVEGHIRNANPSQEAPAASSSLLFRKSGAIAARPGIDRVDPSNRDINIEKCTATISEARYGRVIGSRFSRIAR